MSDQRKCQVCGCTEDHACDEGCSWINDTEPFCTQCVGWCLLRSMRPPLKGVFEHDLIPIRDLMPVVRVNSDRGDFLSVRVDLRRIDRSTVERLAFMEAGNNDGTVEEFLERLERNSAGFLLPASYVKAVFGARNLERAAEMAAEYQARGIVSGSETRGVFAQIVL